GLLACREQAGRERDEAGGAGQLGAKRTGQSGARRESDPHPRVGAGPRAGDDPPHAFAPIRQGAHQGGQLVHGPCGVASADVLAEAGEHAAGVVDHGDRQERRRAVEGQRERRGRRFAMTGRQAAQARPTLHETRRESPAPPTCSKLKWWASGYRPSSRSPHSTATSRALSRYWSRPSASSGASSASRYRSMWTSVPSGVGYSWTRVYVGLLTGASDPSCAARRCTKVVLPAPSGPVSTIRAPSSVSSMTSAARPSSCSTPCIRSVRSGARLTASVSVTREVAS